MEMSTMLKCTNNTENSREWAYENTGGQKMLHKGNSFET